MTHVPAEYWKHVYHYIYYRVGGSHADAEDLTQQVRIAAWQNPPELSTDLWPWLARVARNHLSHWRRARGRERRIIARGEVPDDIGVRQQENTLAAEETGECLRLVMSALEPAIARLLTDKYEKQLSLEIMAQARGMSVDAVKSALARAREIFRSQWIRLARQGEIEDESP